ncbi:S-protein homolog 5-like [Rhododendron vialii]|uniref:S-protein homolog 5-like n=1 Tax=Rhododendron vialii TaxID=182163 RepID=UPI00265EFE26|nr:S-protein homolog 5-like [Rhododendron vialii]
MEVELVTIVTLPYLLLLFSPRRSSQPASRVPDKPTPLNLRCQSKDDDIGYHTLHTGQDLRWSFNRNFWGTTLFFCHFYWGSKTRVFNVYDSSINYDYCLMTSKGHRTCYWEVRPDGFYVSGNQKSWELMNLWA